MRRDRLALLPLTAVSLSLLTGLVSGCGATSTIAGHFLSHASPTVASRELAPAAGPSKFPPPPPGLIAALGSERVDERTARAGTVAHTISVHFINGTPTEFAAVEVEVSTMGVSPAYVERGVIEGGFRDTMLVHSGTLLPGEDAFSPELPGRLPLDQWRYGRKIEVRILGAQPVAMRLDPANADSVWSLIRRARAPEFAAELRKHPEIVHVRTTEGITPTLMACAQLDTGILDAVLNAGGSLEDKTRDGYGPLHFAAISGGREMAEYLLRAGVSLAVKNHDDETPLHTAVQAKNLDVAGVLLAHHAPLEARDRFGFTPLMRTPGRGFLPMAELLIGKGANLRAAESEGNTFMTSAGTYGQIEFLQAGLRHGVKIDERDPKRRLTALHMATKYSQRETIAWLLDHGADPNARSSNGNRPIDVLYRHDANETDRRMVERIFAQHKRR